MELAYAFRRRLWRIIFAAMLISPFPCPSPGHAEEAMVSPESDLWRQTFDPPYKQPTKIPADNPLRKKLFDLLRPKAERIAGKPVRFEGSLKTFKNWAFFIGQLLDQKGDIIQFPPAGNSDLVALWLRTGDGWVVIDLTPGVSDTSYEIWGDKYGAPSKLFGIPSGPSS